MSEDIQVSIRRELQRNPVADEVSAIVAVVRPILHGTLFALKIARAERFGGFERVTLEDLAREYRAGDGDCGICFEYAVHDAVRRRDPMVLERVEDVLSTHCRIAGAQPESILFGAEKAGSQQLIETAKELLTDESSLLSGARGRPVKLKRHIDAAAREFRRRDGSGRSSLPQSISGLWKADLFLGKPESDRWVGTTVKLNASALEGAKGLRVGIVPASTGQDAPRRDEQRNLIVCPLPYDRAFMEVFYRGWGVVKACLAADARVPTPVALPNAADRRVAAMLFERRQFPVVEIVEALAPQAQPELLATDELSGHVILARPTAGTAVGTIVAPISHRA